MKPSGVVALGGFAAVLAMVTGTLLLLTPEARESTAGPVAPAPTRAPVEAPTLAAAPLSELAPVEAAARPLLSTGAPEPPDLVAGLAPEDVLSGTVRDSRGEPVAGAWVAWRPRSFPAPAERWPLYAWPCDHSRPVPVPGAALRVTQTDATGAFALPRRPGFLRVQHPDHTVALVEPRADAATLDLALDDGVTLLGDVSGLPAGSTLSLTGLANPGRGGTRAVSTHSEPLPRDGRYRLTGLPLGRCDLVVLGPDRHPLTSTRLQLLRDQDNRFDIDLAGARPLRVQLEGPAAELAERVSLQDVASGRSAPLTLVGPALWAGAAAWTGRTLLRGSLRDMFSRDGVLTSLDLRAELASYRVTLPSTRLVVHVAIPRPRPSNTVSLRRLEQPSSTSRAVELHSHHVTFETVSPGRYLVSSTDAGGFAHTTLVHVPADTTQILTVLGGQPRALKVHLVGPTGVPLAHDRVELRVGGERMTSGLTDERGRVTLRYSPPGPFPVTLVTFRKRPPTPDGRRGTTLLPRPPVRVPRGQLAGAAFTLEVRPR